MITGSVSVSRDTQVRYLHIHTHDHRICNCFQGYTGSLLTHMYTHTWSQDLGVFPGIHRFVTYIHVYTHMITGSASVSRDTQVCYSHTCTHTHDHRICKCFPGYTGSLLRHMYMHTWSQDLRVFPGIHRSATYTYIHAPMITGSASVSRDTQVRYLHTRVYTHDQRICECFQGYTGSLLTHMYTHTWSEDLQMCCQGYTGSLLTHTYTHTHDQRICECFQGYTGSLLTHACIHTWSEDLRVFPGIQRFIIYTHVHTHMIRGSASVSRDIQVRY